MDLKRIISEACVLIAISALFGLTLNYQLVLDAFSGQLAPQRQVEQEQTATLLPLPVMLEEVQQVLADGGVVVDARSPELFADGHIEGASSLPLVEIDAILAEFLERVPKEQTIVAYCSGFGCPDSFDLGVVLIEEGYMDVRVFEGGYPEWRDAGLPIGGAGR